MFCHRAGGGGVLVADGLLGAAALAYIAVDAAGEADGVRRVDEDGEVEALAERGRVEGEDAFDDEDGCGVDTGGAVENSGVRAEVVEGSLDEVVEGEFVEVMEEQVKLDRVRVVEVLLRALLEGKVGEVAVVEVEWEQARVELRGEFTREQGFARAGAAGDAEDQWAMRQEELLCGRLRGHGAGLRGSLGWRCG